MVFKLPAPVDTLTIDLEVVARQIGADLSVDASPALWEARARAAAAGAAIVDLPEGDIRLTSSEIDLGGNMIVGFEFDGHENLWFRGKGPATNIIPAMRRAFFFQDSTHLEPGFDVASAVGDTCTVTLATPADAANFAVGDTVFLRTGNLTGALGPLGAPLSEYNEVRAVDAGAGTLTLERPLARTYEQEFFNPGEGYATGTTKTTNTGPPAARDIRRVPTLNRNIKFSDLRITHDDAQTYGTFTGAGVSGLTLENVHATVNGRFMSISAIRDLRVVHCPIRITDTTAENATTRWWFTTAFGSTDCTVRHCRLTADRYAWIHINEGSARVRVVDNDILIRPGYVTTNDAAIVMGNRGYDNRIARNLIINGSQLGPGGAGIRIASAADPSRIFPGCRVDHNTIRGSATGIVDNSQAGVIGDGNTFNGTPIGTNLDTATGAKVSRSTNQSIPSNAETAVIFDTEELDTNSYADLGTQATRLTVPPGLAGTFILSAGVDFATSGAGVRTVYLRRNGAERLIESVTLPPASGHLAVPISACAQLAAGDYVELIVYQNSGAALNIQPTFFRPYLSLVRVGA